MAYHIVAVVFLTITSAVAWFARPQTKDEATKAFVEFRHSFLLVYGLCAAGDALSAPCGLLLFTSYGYTLEGIGIMLILANVLFALIGWNIGPLADQRGRKSMCLVQCVMASVSCVLTHFNYFWVMVGGIITNFYAEAIQLSVVEAWLVCEHTTQKGFSGGLLQHMFNLMYTVRNFIHITAAFCAAGIMAVSSNVEVIPGSKIFVGGVHSMFELALAMFVVAYVVMGRTWGENYGGGAWPQGLTTCGTLAEAVKALRADRRGLLVGGLVVCFHGVRTIVTLHGFQILKVSQESPLTAMVWALFAMSNTCGTTISCAVASRLPGTFRSALLMLTTCFLVGSLSCIVAALSGGVDSLHATCFASISLFSFSLGWYWPIMGMLKGEIVPEHVRATLYIAFEFFAKMLGLHFAKQSTAGAMWTSAGILLVGVGLIGALATMPKKNDEITQGGNVDEFYQRTSKAV